MRLSDYLKENLIFLDQNAENKDEAIALLVQKMQDSEAISDSKKLLQEVMERERLGSTCIGKGIALPHARTQVVDQIVVAMMRLSKGVLFHPDDDEPVQLIFLLGTPIKAIGEYLKILSRLSKILKDDKIRKNLLTAQSPAQIREIIAHAED